MYEYLVGLSSEYSPRVWKIGKLHSEKSSVYQAPITLGEWSFNDVTYGLERLFYIYIKSIVYYYTDMCVVDWLSRSLWTPS